MAQQYPNCFDGRKIVIGDMIRVMPHVRYQSIKDGALIDPPIRLDMDGYTTTVVDVYTNEMEDEHGNPVTERIIVTKTGELVDPSEVLYNVMTASQAAKEFGLSESTVRQAINRGQIHARKSGDVWLVARSTMEAHWPKH